MITDKDCNLIYISELLKNKCPTVFKQLTDNFDRYMINYRFLPHTKDLWVVDYMPVQREANNYIQFKYDPDYLKLKAHQQTISNTKTICDEIGINPQLSSIILDGGNVVRCKNKVIITTKVFKENPEILEYELVSSLKILLGVKQIIIIPQEPKDFIGHADGMVRFINDDTVIINKYPNNKVYQDFGLSLRWSIKNAGLDYVEMPYDSWMNKNAIDATGSYINFLEINDYIFYPSYGKPNDQWALIQLQKVFTGRSLIPIDCNELSILGGVLNCATWNIKI
jgi:agmatine deiminase